MNQRKIANWVIYCLTMVAAYLLVEIVVFWTSHHSKFTSPYKATALKMGVALLVFFPAFWLIESLVKASTKRYTSKSKNKVGIGIYGVIIAFAIGLLVLYGYYLKVKFNLNILDKLF